MKNILSLLLVLFSVSVFGQKYPVTDIPADLKKGANAVVRKSLQKIELTDIESASYIEEKAITIFNKDAFGFAVFQEVYDKLTKIKGINITYYDVDGEVIKKVRNSEIQDYSYVSSGAMHDDSRVKYFQPEGLDYPFTIEYSYEYDYKSTMWFPQFVPQVTEDLAVESATYVAVVPDDYDLRYKLLNDLSEPTINDLANDKKEILWEISNLKPVSVEYASLGITALVPYAVISPSTFQMEGYAGDMSSWESFGQWQSMLIKGRDGLTDEVKADVDQLVSGKTDPREKTKLIYEYMQKNTRYVSIQLGIGGYQPFSANEVINTGYGDCKALTNYTYSLLKYAGIKSNYVVIRAGAREEDVFTDFPNARFNHVILSVPMEKDTVWLECTSQVMPFNFLGDFTDNRHALMITDEGKGTIVKTPKYSAEENAQIRKVNIAIDAEGNAEVNSETVFKGLQYDGKFYRARESQEEQRKYLLNTIDIPSFELGTFELVEDRSTETPQYTETIELSIRKFGSTSGKRMFITPNIMTKVSDSPPKDENRKSSFRQRRSYIDIDTVSISLPESMRLEFQAEDVSINTDFGDYSIRYSFDYENNVLTYIRKMVYKEGVFEADMYDAYRDFYRDIIRQDKAKLVLIGNT
ncbi:MAG: DUF3857 and transglutaminase domain-containing protein [Cytophagia bacterium]|nr:DUF3857 and transglutaminase domain-containing protein [Cytophagia bacterium]